MIYMAQKGVWSDQFSTRPLDLPIINLSFAKGLAEIVEIYLQKEERELYHALVWFVIIHVVLCIGFKCFKVI